MRGNWCAELLSETLWSVEWDLGPFLITLGLRAQPDPTTQIQTNCLETISTKT